MSRQDVRQVVLGFVLMMVVLALVYLGAELYDILRSMS